MDTRRSGIERLRNSYFRTVDYWLIVPVLTMTIIGLFVLYQVLSSGYDDFPQNFYRQSAAAVIGIVIALCICLVETHFLKIIGRGIYGVSLILLAIIPFDTFDMTSKWGADAWMSLPGIGVFQPSEIAKIGLILVAAYIFEDMSEKRISFGRGFIYLALAYAPPSLLILKQPDMGSMMVIAFTFICMLFVWGIKYRYFLLGISGIVVSIPFLWNFYLEPFQKQRVLSLLFSGSDPKAEFNLIQSKTAIASGGLIGNTTGTLVKVPVKESDFIFTAISEHMGFIGTTAVIILAFFFLFRCFYIASKAQSKVNSYIVVGIAASFAFHYIENMGMTVGLVPITGIPLPFISLGGTALIVNFISVGILLAISMERK